MSIKQKLISNTTYLFFDWFFVSIVSFIFQIITVKTLSISSYGSLAIILQISTFLTPFCLFGLNATAIILIPRFLKNKENYKVNNLIRFSIKIIFLISFILTFLIILFNGQLSSVFNLDYRIFFLTSFMMTIFAFQSYFGAVLHGFQNMKKYFFTDLYGHLLKVFLLILLIFIGFDYFGPIIAIIIGYIVIFITRIDTIFFKKISNKSQLTKLIFKYSFPAFIVTILSTLLNYTQYIILTFFSMFNISTLQVMENIGYFALSVTISNPILVITNLVASALFPITSELSTEKNSKHKQAYLIKLVLRYIFFLILPISIFLILASKYAILLFSKPEYLPATSILPFIVFASLFIGLGALFGGNLYALKKPKVYRNIFIITVVIYFILSFILTYYFYIYGLVISYMLSNLLFFLLGLFFIKKYLSLKFPVHDFIKIILCLIISSVLYLIFTSIFQSILSVIFFIIISLIFYFGLLLKLNFYIEEDLKILDFFVEKIPIFKNQIKYFRDFLSKFVKKSYH